MTFVPVIALLAQKPGLPPPRLPAPGVAETVAAGGVVAAYEYTPWRKLHPKADLALTFTDPAIPPVLASRIRTTLGCKTTVPVLDTTVFTLVFGSAKRPAPKQLSIEAYVFLGSFPRGFRAVYLLATDGKVPRVLSRQILDKYEIAPAKSDTQTLSMVVAPFSFGA